MLPDYFRGIGHGKTPRKHYIWAMHPTPKLLNRRSKTEEPKKVRRALSRYGSAKKFHEETDEGELEKLPLMKTSIKHTFFFIFVLNVVHITSKNEVLQH